MTILINNLPAIRESAAAAEFVASPVDPVLISIVDKIVIFPEFRPPFSPEI